MATRERDFAMHDKLDMLCGDFMECAFALDLVVWSTSCAQFEGNPPLKPGALDCEYSMSVGDSFPLNTCAHRVNCGIKCGSDIIVRDVIPFLEKIQWKNPKGRLLIQVTN
jgi:hypothetical protein